MEYDPYATPPTHVQGSSYVENSPVSQEVLRQLAGTKPWVRFISVILFIGTGIMMLFGVAMLFVGNSMASISSRQALPNGFGFMLAAIYFVMGILYIYPAIKLWKYAGCIGTLLTTGAFFDLENALGQQRSFWKFFGIIMLLILSLYVLVIVGMITIGGFAAFGHSR